MTFTRGLDLYLVNLIFCKYFKERGMRYRMGKIVKKKFKKEDFEYLVNKTPAQAFTPPADENKMGTIWIFVY